MHDHDRIADRLLHNIDPSTLTPGEQVALAAAHAALAQADATELVAFVGALPHAGELEYPLALIILRRVIRRRLRLFPPLTPEGETENGGEPDGD